MTKVASVLYAQRLALAHYVRCIRWARSCTLDLKSCGGQASVSDWEAMSILFCATQAAPGTCIPSQEVLRKKAWFRARDAIDGKVVRPLALTEALSMCSMTQGDYIAPISSDEWVRYINGKNGWQTQCTARDMVRVYLNLIDEGHGV